MTPETVCVIPALDAERTVAGVITGVRRAVPSVFVLGVDDGSMDGTRAVLRASCDHTIEFDANRGKGAALRAAFAWVAGDPRVQRVLTIDADGQHDPSLAPRLLERLDNADLVIGARDLGAGTVPLHRRFANRLSTAVTRLLTRYPLRDSQSGFRAMRAALVRAIRPRGDRYEFEMDFLVRASAAGYTLAEVVVPTIYGPPSHFRPFLDAWHVGRILWNHRAAAFRPRSKYANPLQ